MRKRRKRRTESSGSIAMMNVRELVITCDPSPTFPTQLISAQYAWFHVIFAMAAMYVAMLLTDWFVAHPPLRNNALKASYRNFVKEDKNDPDQDVYIGRSVTAMWMRVVSSWVCMLLYIWSLIAPVVMPDR
jgi:hypothetical protein